MNAKYATTQMLPNSIDRRTFLQFVAAAGLLQSVPGCSLWPHAPNFDTAELDFASAGDQVNDIQSELNLTNVSQILRPRSTEDMLRAVRAGVRSSQPQAVCGARHSMGGQQFLSNAPLIDMTAATGVYALDSASGLARVSAGIQWPDLYRELERLQPGNDFRWVVREKQTGVDRVSLGGCVSSNIHGRGLTSAPFISDVESLAVVNSRGELVEVSRKSNSELFSLICGGYGMFGLIAEVTLRLKRRVKVRRIVEVIPLADLLTKMASRRREGCIYGDCQYAIDLNRPPEQHPGVLSCYQPVADDTPLPERQLHLSPEAWGKLYELTRSNKPEAFTQYSDYYLRTDGQVYWSEQQQISGDFFRGYVAARKNLGGTELISEFYITEENLFELLKRSQKLLRERNADVAFGSIRFIKQDTESFLAWARKDYVCIVCNLHVDHTPQGIAKVADDFRALIDLVLQLGGSYYLTYHRFARPDQVLTAYPNFPDFLRLKREFDPSGIFQSDWYRHYAPQFS